MTTIQSPLVGSLTPYRKRIYTVTNRLPEADHPIYAIVFIFINSRYYDFFATVGGNRVTVYKCLEGDMIDVLRSYIDDDEDESFYTVCWASDTGGALLLVTGGINGKIRVIDTRKENIHPNLVGHGNSINEVVTAMKCGFPSFRCISYCQLWYGWHRKDLVYEGVLEAAVPVAVQSLKIVKL
ncbi:putative polycomb protein EED [Helianthus annuus]|uniref:Polycomb protein EED n=1 Tax=Helianthus annuus TaxID=4232 RepID=A0A251TT99_HELAN|nr:putative polycomb protein EED [Helianthus annuus]